MARTAGDRDDVFVFWFWRDRARHAQLWATLDLQATQARTPSRLRDYSPAFPPPTTVLICCPLLAKPEGQFLLLPQLAQAAAHIVQ